MFTGIITARCPILSIKRQPGLSTFAVELGAELIAGLERGASVAVNGCCLTATEIDHEGGVVQFDVMAESLRQTTLGRLSRGDKVHVERAARYGDEIGGHHLSGHVTERGRVVHAGRPEANNFELRVEVSEFAIDYIFPKGFVALDGASLTVVEMDREARAFSVWLIPETLRLTHFGQMKPGDLINVELDPSTVAIVQTVERVLASRA